MWRIGRLKMTFDQFCFIDGIGRNGRSSRADARITEEGGDALLLFLNLLLLNFLEALDGSCWSLSTPSRGRCRVANVMFKISQSEDTRGSGTSRGRWWVLVNGMLNNMFGGERLRFM